MTATRMELNNLPEFLDHELQFPVDVGTVRQEVGDTVVAAPDEGESRTLSELLADADDERYGSANELFEALLSRLPDEYVGRKYYDDRGGSQPEIDAVREDERDQSF